MSEGDRCNSEQISEDHVGFSNAGFASEWQLRHPSKGSSAPSVADSFTASFWNPSMTEADLPAVNKPPHLGMAWNHPSSDSLSAGGSFLPPNVYHFASDSSFIKRAARISCFNPYSKIDINMSESGKEDGSLPGSPMVEQDKAALQEGGASSSKGLAAKKRKRSSEVHTLNILQMKTPFYDLSFFFLLKELLVLAFTHGRNWRMSKQKETQPWLLESRRMWTPIKSLMVSKKKQQRRTTFMFERGAAKQQIATVLQKE